MSGYAAPAPIAPLLTGRGDVVAGAGIRPAYPRREASVYVAAAPSESARVYVAGSHTNARGDTIGEYSGNTRKERNHTTEVEAGGGWGVAMRRLRAEVLGGLGYGSVRSTQCDQRHWLDGEYQDCGAVVQAQGSFLRTSIQAQVAAHFGLWTGGGGVRIALVRFDYDAVLGHSGPVSALVPTFEPFMVQRLELPFGSLQFMLHIPVVPYSPSVTLDQARSTRLIESPWPRIYLGFQANLDELWRRRSDRE